MRAAARAEKTFAYEEAARLYGLALSTLDSVSPPDHRRKCELTLSLASALYSSGEFDRAHDQFEEAAAVAIRLGDTDKQAIASRTRFAASDERATNRRHRVSL